MWISYFCSGEVISGGDKVYEDDEAQRIVDDGIDFDPAVPREIGELFGRVLHGSTLLLLAADVLEGLHRASSQPSCCFL